VTIVAAGLQGETAAAEDEICGDVLTQLLLEGSADVAAAASLVSGLERADELRAAEFAHPDDVALCTHSDRFGFAMEARAISGQLTLSRIG
jgi:hypothetical protein